MPFKTTFSSRLMGGFALTVGLSVLMGAACIVALATVTGSKDDVITSATRQLTVSQELSTVVEQRIGDYRAYLLTGADEQLATFTRDRENFLGQVAELQKLITAAANRDLLDKVSQAEVAYAAVLDPIVRRRQAITDLRDISQLNTTQVAPARQALQEAIGALIAGVQAELTKATDGSARTANRAIVLICVLCGLSIAAASMIGFRLNRGLRREVGAAVGHIQSSSAQLEAAADQQVTGGREQATAMNEITTTISELLITSRQIAENAHRVSGIAVDTEQAAQEGDATIDQTRQSIAAIRSQSDRIVQNMLDLGEKSQEISGVVDLVTELAEQTNILAVNATIEAAGAGEWGRRFTVVAEEIRKLADRTADSAKQIRGLVEDVRGAVNTTVMATEMGAKAVDAGVRQFDHATTSFRHIADLVATASDASREIQLSTNQQTTAVEQANAAVMDTARVSRETEASAVQTRQTAAHLATLSGDLQNLVGVRGG
jgi:methyl-accepting chemotaxis protein